MKKTGMVCLIQVSEGIQPHSRRLNGRSQDRPWNFLLYVLPVNLRSFITRSCKRPFKQSVSRFCIGFNLIHCLPWGHFPLKMSEQTTSKDFTPSDDMGSSSSDARNEAELLCTPKRLIHPRLDFLAGECRSPALQIPASPMMQRLGYGTGNL